MKLVFPAIAAMALAAACPAHAAANDGWQSVTCSAPVPAALIGKHMPNETVAAIEARHKDLMLHDLGAEEISDAANAIWWMICGKEYVVLEEHDVVRDVLPFPAHSKEHPEFLGTCQRDGKDMDQEVTAVLDNTGAHAGKPALPATSAWRIDERAGKFVAVPTGGLMCPRSGISTADGGT